MGLADRHYMRQPSFGSRWPLTSVLLVANVAAFLVQCVAYGYPPLPPQDGLFALSLKGLQHGYVWQLLTFQFMHSGLLHLLFNCIAIYFFGRAVEEALGEKNFLILYLTSGVVGGLMQIFSGLLWPTYFGSAVVGASAGAFGLVAAFATLYPDRTLTLLLFFVLPISIRAKYLLLFSALLAIFGMVFMSDSVAHAAHLGGMAIGVLYVRQIIHWHWPRWRGFPRTETPPRQLVQVQARKAPLWRRPQIPEAEDLSPDEFLAKEVDPILDKISQHGIHSLTERERKILETARKKIERR